MSNVIAGPTIGAILARFGRTTRSNALQTQDLLLTTYYLLLATYYLLLTTYYKASKLAPRVPHCLGADVVKLDAPSPSYAPETTVL